MNYRHGFHAGNFADVIKHVLLVRLLRALQLKEKGFLFLDTHAGRGGYDLAGLGPDAPPGRRPEHEDGIGRIWGRPDAPEPVADYLDLVRRFERRLRPSAGSELPRRYPGSPWLARLVVRPQDRMALCERHPEEFLRLRRSFAREKRVSLHPQDGYAALRAFLPPPEKRALVLIDPSFESEDEWARLAEALQEGLERFPSGVYAAWYPLTERARIDAFFGRLRGLRLPPALAAEAVIRPQAPKMRGCGLLVINPPWRFEEAARPALHYLADKLAPASDGEIAWRWLQPE